MDDPNGPSAALGDLDEIRARPGDFDAMKALGAVGYVSTRAGRA